MRKGRFFNLFFCLGGGGRAEGCGVYKEAERSLGGSISELEPLPKKKEKRKKEKGKRKKERF